MSAALRSGLKPPRFPGVPILGNALQVLRSPLESLLRAYHDHGPIFRVAIPGREIVIIAGREANELLALHEEEYFRSRDAYATLAAESGSRRYLFATDGDDHNALRRTLRPAFSREALAPALPQIVDDVQRTARSWTTGQSLKVMDTFHRLLMSGLSLALANMPLDGHYGAVKTFTTTFVGVGLALHPTGELLLPTYQIAKRRVQSLMERIVAEHRASPPDGKRPPDMVDSLLTIARDPRCPFHEQDLVAYTHLPYVNSFTYVGRVFGFLLYALLKNPDLMQRVTAEVDAAFAHGVPDAATLRRMKTLRGAVMETLRLYPVALGVLRHATRDFEFGGYPIRRDQFLIVGTSVAHFLPEFYADPFNFDIDRFAPPRSEHQQTGAFAPFGLGTHTCLSAGLVETMLMISAAALLYSVRLELPSPDYELEIAISPLRSPSDRFTVRVVEHRTPPTVSAEPPLMSDEELSLILPGLDRAALKQAAARLRQQTYHSGETIIRQGDPANAFYILVSGEVEVIKEEGGSQRVVAQLSEGQYFGEIGLLQGVSRTASVRVPEAGSDVEVLALDRESFLNVVAESDLTSAEISHIMRQRVLGTRLAMTLPSLDHRQIALVMPSLEMAQYQPGEVILRQGDPADKFYTVLRGRVDVVTQHPGGQEIHLAALGEGEYFGEIGLLQGKPRSATVRAAQDSPVEVLALDRESFRSLLNESAQTAGEITAVMLRRLRETG